MADGVTNTKTDNLNFNFKNTNQSNILFQICFLTLKYTMNTPGCTHSYFYLNKRMNYPF